MKRTERHHLKENEVALSVARARETFETYRKPIVAGVVALVLVVVAVVGLTAWRRGSDADARVLLADAMAVAGAPVAPAPAPGTNAPAPAPGTYPSERAKLEAALQKFKAAADAHPSSDPGIAARYHEAAVLTALGRYKEAEQQYRAVVDRAGAGLYGQMARLGLANTQAAGGQYDQAIAAFKELSAQKETDLPVDAILMQLGRTYLQAGKADGARKTFTRVTDEFPQSPYASLATRELAQLKG